MNSIQARLLLFILLAITFNACGGTPKPMVSVKPKEIPSWFMKPPKSTSSTLYSIGEGSDKKDALANALNNMVATLSVSIESSFKSTSSTENINGVESYTKRTNNNINATVKKIRISNYTIVNSEKLGFNKYLILIRAEKIDIFNSLKNEVDQQLALLRSEESNIKSSNVLEQLKFYKNASTKTESLLYQAIIMKVLNPSFDDTYINKAVAHYKNRYTTIRDQISFSIRSDKEAKNLVSVIKEALNSKGLKNSSKQDKYHLNLFISAKIVYANAYDFTIARTTVVISVKDYKKRTISTKQLHINGQSTQGKKVAKENIAYKLSQLIKNNGIKAIINIEL